MTTWLASKTWRRTVWLSALLAVVAIGAATLSPASGIIGSAAMAQEKGVVPGDSIGGSSTSDMWRAIRQGQQGNVSLPEKRTGVMIQSEGENWRALRNGPVSNFGAWLLAGMLVLLLAFYLLRGRIKVDSGLSGRLVQRFNSVERFSHWVTASSFVVLGLTGRLDMKLPSELAPESGQQQGVVVHQKDAGLHGTGSSSASQACRQAATRSVRWRAAR